jgi:hypothetical protein
MLMMWQFCGHTSCRLALTAIDGGGRWLGLKGEAAVLAVVSMMEVNNHFAIVCVVQLSVEFEH